MKPGDAAILLGIGRSTLTAWTSGEWRAYLSPSAQGGDGSRRDLTETDLQILATINTMKKQGHSSNEIHTALHQMQADGWDNLQPLNSTTNGAPTSVGASAALAAYTQTLLREIAILREQMDTLESKLDTEREKRLELERELARAQTELDLRRQGWQPPKP
jgi:DNA-binding transcriptional MerR regulator